MSLKNLLGILLIIVGIFFIINIVRNGTPIFAWGDQEVLESEAYPVSGELMALNIETSDADIELKAGDQDGEVIIEVIGYEKTAKKFKLKAELDGSEGTITYKREGAFSWFGIQQKSHKLSITVPERVWNHMNVNASSGDIAVRDIRTDHGDFDASSGDIAIKHTEANQLSIQTSSGDILLSDSKTVNADVKASSGDIEWVDVQSQQSSLRATSGDISVERGTGQMDLKSSSGDIELTLTEGYGDITSNSSSGDIEIELPEEPQDIRFDLRTSSGDVDVRVGELDQKDQKENRFEGQKGTGSIEIYAKTSSGDVEVTAH
ncbi:DUF4097 family beta strand repeat-containing protein [Marinicrinis lubricantis]|uniref:DUF4097 family beta strand repeat-containing protein n=1 Tax=Marinicrinis lubricantis TaxID=2086470 RepID=A0ABW1ITZ0_9BACL